MKFSFYACLIITALLVWLIAGWRIVYRTIVGSKTLTSPSTTFFSLKDLFLHLFFLSVAVIGYIGAFTVAQYIIEHASIASRSPLSAEGWPDRALYIQAAGVVLVLLFLLFLQALLPDSVRKRIVGTANGWKEWIKGVGLGILIWPAITSVLCAIQFAISGYKGPVAQYAVESLLSLLNRPLFFALVAFEIACIVPFLEEVIFRGYLLSFLRGTIHPFFAYILSSVLFAWMHYSIYQQASNWAFLPALFLFGLCAALIRDSNNSLTRVVGLHTGFNTTSILVLMSGITQ